MLEGFGSQRSQTNILEQGMAPGIIASRSNKARAKGGENRGWGNQNISLFRVFNPFRN